MSTGLQERTIADFGEQWTAYDDHAGYFGSAALFDDIFAPFVAAADLAGCRVAEIGAGAGRFVNVMAGAGAAHVVALEPSAACDVLSRQTARYADRVTCLPLTGDRLPPSGDLDYVFAIGVLHHIPEPAPVVAAAFAALRPGGRMAAWLYGREGNGLYLLVARSLWGLSRRLPHRGLVWLVWVIYPWLWAYMHASRVLPLPLGHYMRRVILPLAPDKRRLVVYDQLNPAYARYYTQAEAQHLLEAAGFADVRVHHRHGYSWTVVGTKP